MVVTKQYASKWFWNQLGFAIAVFSIGCSYSISQANQYELKLAEYKLTVGSALSDIQKASTTLEQSANKLDLAPNEKLKIDRSLKETNKAIEEVQEKVDIETEKLLHEVEQQ